MGRTPVFVPVDRLYARNHMWALEAEGGFRLGLSAYAVRLLGEVRHLGWSVKEGDAADEGMPLGYIEAAKATSDLYAPIPGRVEAIRAEVLARPLLVNTNPYGAGWLLNMSGDGRPLLSPEQYLAHLEAAWPLAQRLLKAQAGRKP